MAFRSSDAFVLTAHPLGEGDKICSLFTKEFGKVRAVAAGARRPKSRFGASLEPLTEVHASFYDKETRELVRLYSCDLLFSAFEKSVTPEGEAFLHHIAEVVDKFQPPHEPNGLIYRLLKATIEAFKQGSDTVALGLYFKVWTLKLGGFFGEFESCINCGRRFNDQETIRFGSDAAPHCLNCNPSLQSFYVQAPVRRELNRMLKIPPAQWAKDAQVNSTLHPLRQMVRRLVSDVLEYEMKTELSLSVSK
jgi:DNA repair protein RecO (recombination protein O)